MSTINSRLQRAADVVADRRGTVPSTGMGPVPAPPVVPKPVRVSLPCVHEEEGAPLEYCKTCHGPTAEGRHVRGCDLHDKCTRTFVSHLVRWCGRCPDYQPVREEAPPPDSIPAGEGFQAIPQNVPDASGPVYPPLAPIIPVRRPVRPVEPRPGARTGRLGSRFSPVSAPATVSVDPVPSGRGRRWKRPPVWAYGVTTVPERRVDLLPRTLTSLAGAGFERPTLFVDGEEDASSWRKQFGLEVVCRFPRLRVYGNWVLALAELYIRNPWADFYAIFQDDFVTGVNLRRYLELVEYPDKGYMNLYTFPKNQAASKGRTGFYRAVQRGKGAVALVFDPPAVQILLAHNHMVKRVRDRERGHKYVDGSIVETMNLVGFSEYVHSPSLVQHTGVRSTTHNPQHPTAPYFPGEKFDFLTLLPDHEESSDG